MASRHTVWPKNQAWHGIADKRSEISDKLLPRDVDSDSMRLLIRIALWFGCLLFSAVVFSASFGLTSHEHALGALLLILRVTLLFALPVSCLYLLLVGFLRNPPSVLSATLFGPAAIVLWCLFLQLKGGNADQIWIGDPLAGGIGGGIAFAVFAAVVGFMTGVFYIAAVRIVHWFRADPPADRR